MKTNATRTLVSAVMLFALAACGGGDDPSGPKNVGTVKGVVYAADGTTPIPQATVTLAQEVVTGTVRANGLSLAVAAENAPSTVTDLEGRFTLNNVPLGEQTLIAKRGIFEATFTVNVQEGKTVTAPPAELVSTGKLAYLPGSYDSIEDIVRDQLQNPMDQLTTADFADAAKLAEYKMIFVNCGASVYNITSSTTTLATVRAWVEGGGILYASDWANVLVEALYPDDFSGNTSGDQQLVNATVVDTDLRAFVGKNTVAIQYDLGAWRAPETISTATKVLVRGSFESGSTTLSNRPLAVYLAKGEGKVVFTSFHNEAGVTEDQLAVLRYFIYLD